MPAMFDVTDYGATGGGTVDDRAAIQAAIDAAHAAGGGTVIFPAGTYLLDSTGPLKLTPNRTGNKWLRLSGYGATILIGSHMSAASRGFLSTNRTADDQTLARVIVEGFDIDGNKSSAPASEGLRGGNIFATTGTTSGGRLNFEDIVFRDIYSHGLPPVTTYNTGTGAYNNQTHLYMACYHTTQGEAQNTVRRVKVQNVRMEDGVHGVFTGGMVASGTGCEVYYDDILYEDCLHDFKVTHTSNTGSNFQVGGHAFGDRVVIERCEGRWGNDTSFEVNAFQDLVYRDCVTKDCRGAGFYARDFHAPQNAMAKTWVVEGCRAVYANLAPDAAGNDCRGLVIGAQTSDKFGSVVVRDYLYDCSVAQKYDGPATANGTSQNGHAIFLSRATAKTLRLDNVEVRETNIALDTTTRGGTYSPVSIRPQTDTEKMRVVIDGLHFRQAGSIVSAPNGFVYQPVFIGCDPGVSAAEIVVDIKNVDYNLQLPSNANYGITLLGLARHTATVTTLHGIVRQLNVISTVATAGGITGVSLGDTSRCVIDTVLVFEGCNFASATANQELTTVGGTSNAPSICMRDCTLRSTSTLAGAAPIAINPGATPYTYRNLDMIREEVRITGGAVSNIAHSRDNVTFGTIASATGERVVLEPGHAIKVTYTPGAQPTMTKTLQR